MQLSMTEESDLLVRLSQGDSDAFALFYKIYIKKIYAFALSIVKSPMLAEDITHDTFVRLWKNASNIQVDRPLQAYLFTITKNLALNTIRKASRETWICEEIISNAVSTYENGLQFTQRRDTGKFIQIAIDQLPPQRRIIYDLCRNHSYSYKQVAEKLGIKDSTVNSQMVKANKAIKDFMKQNGVLLLILFYKI